jgi:hypothetical protein
MQIFRHNDCTKDTSSLGEKKLELRKYTWQLIIALSRAGGLITIEKESRDGPNLPCLALPVILFSIGYLAFYSTERFGSHGVDIYMNNLQWEKSA